MGQSRNDRDMLVSFSHSSAKCIKHQNNENHFSTKRSRKCNATERFLHAIAFSACFRTTWSLIASVIIMPTFESIPLDPALKQQLLEPPNPDGVSITTPQALLSRTPQALVDQLLNQKGTNSNGKISNDEMLKQIDILRSQVAHSMMAQTMMGKYRLRQQQLYDDTMVLQQQYDRENITAATTEQYYANRPLILGATVNAMQAWKQEQERKGPVTSLSTGCRAMDELLSLPSEYSNSQYVQQPNDQSQVHPHHPGEMIGLPRGHMLCYSGHSGSGKSQWCLQIAAQALRQYWKSSSRPVVRYCYSSAGHNGQAMAHRLSQLLQYQVSPMMPSSSSSLLSRALEKIEFQPMLTTTQLIATLKALEEELLEVSCYGSTGTSQSQQVMPPLVLIVDSLSNLDVQGNPSQVSRLYRNLKRLARQYSLWVVVTLSETTNGGATNLVGDYHVVCQSLTTTTTPSTVTTTIQATVRKHPTKFEQPSITLFHTPSGMSTRAS